METKVRSSALRMQIENLQKEVKLLEDNNSLLRIQVQNLRNEHIAAITTLKMIVKFVKSFDRNEVE